MSPEIIAALIAVVSGGGLAALINLLLDYKKQQRTTREKNVDDRIAAWQKISDKNERRIEMLEKKIEIYNSDKKSLERYILELEQIIVRANPPLQLPPKLMPQSENNQLAT